MLKTKLFKDENDTYFPAWKEKQFLSSKFSGSLHRDFSIDSGFPWTFE